MRLPRAASAWAREPAEALALQSRRGFAFARALVNPPDAEVGATPSEVVWAENKLQLRRYRTKGKRAPASPLLVVYALVNRPYILDLQPGRSVVEHLGREGLDVFLIDWGAPSELDRHLTLDDYVNRYIRGSVEVARDLTGAERVNVLGYCMGGSMSAMFAALHPGAVETLALMAAPLTFGGKTGLLHQWSDPRHFDVDRLVDAMGNVPPEFLNGGYMGMKPVANGLGKAVGLYRGAPNRAFLENWLRMERWVRDGIPVAGDAYRQFIKDLYQKDALAQGRLEVGGRRVDPKRITMPFLNMVGEYDHLVPPAESLPFNDVIGSRDKKSFVVATGHIGLSVSHRAHRELWPKYVEWLFSRQRSRR